MKHGSLGLFMLIAVVATVPTHARVDCISSLDSEIVLRWYPSISPGDSGNSIQDVTIIAVPPDADCSIQLTPFAAVSNNNIEGSECTVDILSDSIFRLNRLLSLKISAQVPIEHLSVRSLPPPVNIHVRFTYYTDRNMLQSDSSPIPDPFDPIVESLVSNPDAAARWKIRQSQPRPIPLNVPKPSRAEMPNKILISRDGLFHISRPDGYASIDPRTVRITNGGIEIPIRVNGEEDGVFDPGDTIEWIAEANRQADGSADPYTDTNVYWLSGEGVNGQRLQRHSAVPGPGTPAAKYIETIHQEENQETFAGDFFWMRVLAGNIRDLPFHVDHRATSSSTAQLRVRIRGATDVEADPDHHIRIRINNQIVVDQTFNGYDWPSIDASFPLAWLMEGTNTFRLECPGDTGAGDIDGVYLDWFEVDYPRSYVADSDAWLVRSPDPFVSGVQNYRITGFSAPVTRLYRVSDPAVELTGFVSESDPGEGYLLRFSVPESSSTQYRAATFDSLGTPDSVEPDESSDWRTATHGADYLIISHRDFIDALEPLIDHRRNQGLRVVTVDVTDIYDEFNHGVFDPHAITAFCAFTFENWERPAPSYVLLVGDASWDYKQCLPQSIKRNFVPSYTKTWFDRRRTLPHVPDADSFGSTPADWDFLYGEPMVDDQFVCVSGDDAIPDMMIGRWAVETVAETNVMVQKTIVYEQTARDQLWQKRLTFVTGGFDDSEQDLFFQQSETLIERCVMPSGRYWHLNRIYKTTDNPHFGTYEENIISAIDNGTSVVTFLGHAGSWSWEAMFDFDDLARLDDHGKLPFIASMTCNTARFANPDIDSFGEQFVHNQDAEKGAVAFWGGCNFGGFWTDYYLTYFWTQRLFLDRLTGAGASIIAAKTQALLTYPDYAVIIEPYTLLGDPALRIGLPSAPIIRLAGWFDSNVSSSIGGRGRLIAWVFDPDGLAHIAQVEVMVEDTPTGVMLRDDGLSGDFEAGDGVFGLQFDAGGGIAAGRYGVGIRATDIDGHAGAIYSLGVQ